MEKEIIATKNAPAALGPHSQAVKAGGFVFTSGQLPLDPSSGKMVGDGIENETRQTLENLKAILEASGSSLNEVVKTTVFITDMDDFAKMNAIYGQYFAESFPARATVEVSGLAKNAKVEIQAIAMCE